MRRSSRLVVAGLMVALLVGCTPGPSPTVGPTSSSSTSPSASGNPVDPDAPQGQCASSSLAVSIEYEDAAAGSKYYKMVFTNSGSQKCALRGAPGVSVVGDGNGTQIGAAADQSTAVVPGTVELAPGGRAVATLQASNIGRDGGPWGDACPVVSGDGYRVYPPHSVDAIFVPVAGLSACNSDVVWLHISAVQAG